MKTETYKWIINSLSDKESCLHTDEMKDNRDYLIELISDRENLSKELGGNWNHMNDYQENMEILRSRNNINSSTNENLQ
jgi:hypothetical protein